MEGAGGVLRMVTRPRGPPAEAATAVPYPASASTVTGTSTARQMRAAAASISSRGACSWSSYPSAAATPALVVATAGKPAASTTLAVAASQAFGSTTGSPGTCSERSESHWRWRSDTCRSLTGTLYVVKDLIYTRLHDGPAHRAALPRRRGPQWLPPAPDTARF